MIKKLLSILLMATLLLGKGSYVAFAVEAPDAPEAPSAPEAPESPGQPVNDEAPTTTTTTEAVEAPEAPGGSTITPSPTPEQSLSTLSENHEGTSSDGNVGDTSIGTGDATTTGGVITTANSNLSETGGDGCCGAGGVSIANTDNGAYSDNDGSATVASDSNTNQDNSAVVLNTMTQASVSGDNSTSLNVGDSSIITGDANTSGTVITAANTNVDGLSVSEFNIVGDQLGDYILDFDANCIVGCSGDTLSIANADNGAYSDNSGTIDNTTNNTTNQTNDGTVTNDVDLLANSGYNDANYNTGGDTSIITGDANVVANLLTFLNNNIAGEVIYGVVNIFGNLVGDIIIPDDVFDQFLCGTCGGDTSLVNSGNGTYSDNNGTVNDVANTAINQFNDADIQNNLLLSAETGENSAAYNTGGDVNIQTGDTSLDASILNLANLNMVGGNMWLVIVNEAGNWFGKIIGADGTMLASIGLNLFQDPASGEINVSNTDNGAYSTNDGTVNNTSSNVLNQTNTADLVNNVNLSANTGYNDANYNTGGDVNIQTGDAKVLANLINFVNNNIAGGKLLIAFVNVFGSWTGDLITPGHPKLTTQNAQSSSNNNSSAEQNSASSSTSSTNTLPNPIVAAVGFFAPHAQSNSEGSSIIIADIQTPDVLASLTKGTVSKPNININLAWALFALPLLGITLFARKIYLKRQSA